MFESASLGRTCSAREYDAVKEDLRTRLFAAQRAAIERGIPVLVIVEGINGAGRDVVVNMLSEWMDAKYIHNHTFWLETDEEKSRPRAWRYWRKLPGKGQMGVFYGGWYSEPVRRFCCGKLEEDSFDRQMYRWARLERSLAASGTLIVKFWLHIGKKAHKERLERRLKHKDAHFAAYDRKSEADYDGLSRAAARAITITDRADAPWTLIDAFDPNFRNAAVAQALTSAINAAVAAADVKSAGKKAAKAAAADVPADLAQTGDAATAAPKAPFCAPLCALDAVDLGKSREQKDYKKKLAALQSEIYDLTYRAYRKGISSTLVFEGWDAAGKGGAIRRLTAGIDARIARVIPISAPTDEELAHNYLWRFWRHVPMAGFVTVYDRSWYGRVLVERVEKLTPPADWKRAYAEINDFEEQLQERNNIVLKFWMHISQEEQLRRFRSREETPWKTYKITAEDWRNRANFPAYMDAVEEMFARTSTEYAPWKVIPAEDKKYARLEVLKTYRDALKKTLKRD